MAPNLGGLGRGVGALVALDTEPIMPQDSPAALMMDWSIKAAVVFPLVPVMPTILTSWSGRS